MKFKTLLNECKCIHCQQKLEQINNSSLYWNKLILRKNLTQFILKVLLEAQKSKPKIAIFSICYVQIINKFFTVLFESSLN